MTGKIKRLGAKIKLSELIKKDKAGFGIWSAYGWTCSKCVLEGFKVMKERHKEETGQELILDDRIEEALEEWLPKLKCECVPEKNLEVDEEGLKLLREREEGPVADDDFLLERDIEKPQLVEPDFEKPDLEEDDEEK